jgi:hypothetical protein
LLDKPSEEAWIGCEVIASPLLVRPEIVIDVPAALDFMDPLVPQAFDMRVHEADVHLSVVDEKFAVTSAAPRVEARVMHCLWVFVDEQDFFGRRLYRR